MAKKTKEEIASSLISYIQAYRPSVDTSSGTVLRDVVIQGISTMLELSYDEIDNLRKSQSAGYEEYLTDAQVDDLAARWGLERLEAVKSQGTLTFIKYGSPQGVVQSTVPVTASTLKNTDGTYQSFTTLTSVYMDQNTPLNLATGYYEVAVSATADVAGAAGNVAAGTITSFSGISGIDAVVNRLPFIAGTDKESNSSLLSRISTAAQGRLIGTVPGYQSLVEAVPGVIDVAVVTAEDQEALRSAYGNEVDVILLGSSVVAATETHTFSRLNGLTVNLTNLPVVGIAQITGATLSFTQDVDFVLVKDDFSDFRNSNAALDRIVWIGSNNPADGEQYSVDYTYNKLVGDVQSLLDLDENHLVASDVVAREGATVLVDIAFTAAVFSGPTKQSAREQIITELTDYINSLGMGESLEQYDLISTLSARLPFIDNIGLPFTKLCRRGGTGASDLVATKLEYFRVDEDSFAILVT